MVRVTLMFTKALLYIWWLITLLRHHVASLQCELSNIGGTQSLIVQGCLSIKY